MSAIASWIRVTIGGVRWRIDPAYEQALLGPGGLIRPDEPASPGTGRLQLAVRLQNGDTIIVKQGYHRTVYRVKLDGVSCYIKQNRIMGWRSWWRELLRGCKSVNECTRLLEIAKRGVPTAKPIAVGEAGGTVRPGESYLITQALDDVETLLTVLDKKLPLLEGTESARLRMAITEALAELLATLHDAGVLHRDLHAANILIRLTGDRPELFLIDLHSVRLGRPLDWKESRDNLVLLHRWAVGGIPRTERLRFWKAYWRARKHRPAALPSAAEDGNGRIANGATMWGLLRTLTADVERRTWLSNKRFWRRRDRRCLRGNRYFRRVHSPQAVGYAVSDFDREVVAKLLADPDAPFRCEGVHLHKDSRSSTVAEMTVRIGGVERTLIYKRFRMPKWHAPWVSLVRRAPVVRSWVAGHGLIERGIPTPRPLLMLQRRHLGMCRQGYLVTERIDGVNLHALLRGLENLGSAERRALLQRNVEAVARLIARLHRAGVSHRDLKADNVLVERGGLHGVKCWLIDLVGVSRPARLSRKRRVQNLARLNASFHGADVLSRTDRLRFLLTYLQLRPGGRDNWRSWWKDVALATEEKVAHNERTGRVLG